MSARPPEGEGSGILTVSELNSGVRMLLERVLPDVWVRGEISGFTAASSGHFYFTLKDEGAQVSAAFFRGSQLRGLHCQPRNGLEVAARGRVTLYEPRGAFQLVVSELHEFGVGLLQRRFEELKEKLRREGLFEESRKRPLPLLPTRVGVVTSPTGAAIRDILQVLSRRNSSVQVLVWPARVQGEGAAAEIAEGIEYFSRSGEVDVVIAGRGGGSYEDLWAFNEEGVARAIFACRVPVISAVGHEIDFTIADFVADHRAPTPSAAAEVVARASVELGERLTGLSGRLCAAWDRLYRNRLHRLELLVRSRGFAGLSHRIQVLAQHVDGSRSRLAHEAAGILRIRQRRLEGLTRRLAAVNPVEHLREGRRRLDLARQGLGLGADRALRTARSRLELAAGRLEGLSPRAVLERGYAVCLGPGGRAVRSHEEAPAGSRVEVLLHRGGLGCRVEECLPPGPSGLPADENRNARSEES